MFRVLVVEDDEMLLGDLKELIEETLEGTTVDTAKSVEEALKQISPSYALAVLDIRLPERTGMHPEADMKIPSRLRECNVPSICITGHAGTPDVDQYIQERKLSGPGEEVIPKSIGPQFPNKLLRHIRKFLEGRTSKDISHKIRAIFGGEMTNTGVYCGTGPLLSLEQEIVEYWPYLDETARKNVRNWFSVEEEDGHVTGITLVDGSSQP